MDSGINLSLKNKQMEQKMLFQDIKQNTIFIQINTLLLANQMPNEKSKLN